MLVQRFQENINALRYVEESQSQPLLFAIARADYIFVESCKAKIETSRDRLALFSKHAELIDKIESFLIALNNSPKHRYLQHKWELAIDNIANLNYLDSQIEEFAVRLQALSSIWSSLTSVFHQLQSFPLQNNPGSSTESTIQLDDYFRQFVTNWDLLWNHFFAWDNQDFHVHIKSIASNIADIELKLQELY